MKYCVKCGLPLEDDTVFCVYCGIRLPSQEETKTKKIQEETTQPSKEELGQPKSTNLFGIAGLCLSMFAFVTAFVALIVSAAAHDMGEDGGELFKIMGMGYPLANLFNSVLGIVFSGKGNTSLATTGKMLGFVSIGINMFTFIIAVGASA